MKVTTIFTIVISVGSIVVGICYLQRRRKTESLIILMVDIGKCPGL